MIEWYARPLRAVFVDSGIAKWAVSIVVAVAWGIFDRAGEIYSGLLQVPPSLLVVVGTLWALDLINGILRVLRTEGIRGIESIHLRRSVLKFVEYIIAILAADMLASTEQYIGILGMAVGHVGNVVAVLIAATEFKSIDENLNLSLTKKLEGIMENFPDAGDE